MPHEHALTMAAASRSDFQLLMGCVSGLLLPAALLSPQPLLLLIVTLLFLAATLWFPASLVPGNPTRSCALNLSRNGRIALGSDQSGIAEGKLSGVQWCSRFLAILRYRSDGAVQYCVLIAARQSPDSFRQLCVWLRHNHSEEENDQP